MTLETDALIELVIQQIWQVTLVAALAAFAMRWFCRRRPHLAYLLGLVVLAKCWVPPVFSSPGGVFCWPPTVISATTTNATTAGEAGQTVDYAGRLDIVVASPSPQAAVHPDPASRLSSDLRQHAAVTPVHNLNCARSLFIVWLAGACGLLGVSVVQMLRWRRRLGAVSLPKGVPLDEMIDEIAGRLGLRHRPRVVVSSASAGPAAYGLLRPTIVIPIALVADRNQAKLQMVLAHEMTHIRRGDLLVALVQFATQLVWWFHPLIWWTCRQLTRERERSCDEAVLSTFKCSPDSYAQCLLDVLRLKRLSPMMPSFPGMRAVDVTRSRFEHIMQSSGKARRHTPLRYWFIAAAVSGAVLPGARLTIATPKDSQATAQRDAAEIPGSSDGDFQPATAKVVSPDNPRPGIEVVALTGDEPAPATVKAEDDDELRSSVSKAVHRGTNYLIIQQENDGSWPDPVGYPGGITGLCTLVLVRSGANPQAPCLHTALAYLRPLKPLMTYSTAIQTMVFCAADPKAEQNRIQRNVDWLVDQQKQRGPLVGAWGYPQAEGDGSNTGFAALALYAAEQAGVKADRAVWKRLFDYWINNQNTDGSWGYKPSLGGTGSMTSQGLFCLSAATKVLGEDKADRPGPQAMEKAAEWLGRNFSAMENPGSRGVQGWQFYYLHALGQAGRTAGKTTFGEHDWFKEAAKVLLDEQQLDGSWKGTGHAEDNTHVATSLALLFLLQGVENAK
jgi:beta-lactamase regulating signal transducer with metallopeptidase domain